MTKLTDANTYTHRLTDSGVGPCLSTNTCPQCHIKTLSFLLSLTSSSVFLTSCISLCGSAQTWCSFTSICCTVGEIRCFYCILAMSVLIGPMWIIYTYCMDKSLDVALLVVYCYYGGALSIVLKAHLYLITQSYSANICFRTHNNIHCGQSQLLLKTHFNIAVNFNKSNPTSSPQSDTICKCVSTILNMYSNESLDCCTSIRVSQ